MVGGTTHVLADEAGVPAWSRGGRGWNGPCGRGYPLLARIEGRTSEILVGAQGRYVWGSPLRFRNGIGGIASWAGAVVHRDDLLELSYVFARALGVVVAGDDG